MAGVINFNWFPPPAPILRILRTGEGHSVFYAVNRKWQSLVIPSFCISKKTDFKKIQSVPSFTWHVSHLTFSGQAFLPQFPQGYFVHLTNIFLFTKKWNFSHLQQYCSTIVPALLALAHPGKYNAPRSIPHCAPGSISVNSPRYFGLIICTHSRKANSACNISFGLLLLR